MWYWDGEPGWGGATLMVASMLIFWAVLIWGIWRVLRVSPGAGQASPERSPEQVLAHRFAAGEIDADTYHRGLDVLAGRDGLLPR